MDITDIEVINNSENNQFEIRNNDLVAKIPYRMKEGLIAFFHTQVPKEWRGRGLASKLAIYALNYAKDNKLMVIPYCPFIKKYIEEHPVWKSYVYIKKSEDIKEKK